MAVTKTKANRKKTNVGQGCGETGIQVHCWWEYKMVLPLWKNGKAIVTVLQKVKNREFSGGLVVRIPGFPCHAPRSIPGRGTEILQAQCGQKQKNKNTHTHKQQKKLKIELLYNPAIPLLDIYSKELKAGTQTDICTPMFKGRNN